MSSPDYKKSAKFEHKKTSWVGLISFLSYSREGGSSHPCVTSFYMRTRGYTYAHSFIHLVGMALAALAGYVRSPHPVNLSCQDGTMRRPVPYYMRQWTRRGGGTAVATVGDGRELPLTAADL